MMEIIFAVATFVGALAHYLKKYTKGETTVPIHEWFGKKNIAGTLLSIITIVVTIIAALGFGLIVPGMNIYVIMYTGFLTGYSIDSSLNSDGISNINNVISSTKSKTEQ